MLGDFLREAAVLVIVFYPLDRYFNDQHPESGNIVPVKIVAGLSSLLLIAGMMLEKLDFGKIAILCIDRGLNAWTAMRNRLKGGKQ